MNQHFFRRALRNHLAQFFQAGATKIGDAAEFAQQALGGARADSGNLQQRRRGLALAAALTVEGDGEAVSFIANLLNQVQDGRMALQDDRFVFLAVHVKDFFLLGDAGEGLIDDLQRFERFGGGVKLADAAVNQNQAGHGLFLFLQAAIAARHGFAHAGEIVVLYSGAFAANDEFAVVAFFHAAAFPDDHEATVSVPWMWEMSKLSMRFGSSARLSAFCRASAMARELGLRTRKRCSKECAALFFTRSSRARFWPRCGVRISTLWPARSPRISSSTSLSSKSSGT